MAKMSENSAKLLTYLKENASRKMTLEQIADGCGLPKATITGTFTSFVRKGWGVREEAQVNGTADVVFLSVTDAGKDADKTSLTDNANAIIDHLVAINNAPLTLDDLAEAINIDKKVVNGVFNGLVRKGFCARTAATIEAPVTVKYLVLTEDGLASDPDAE